MDCRSGADKGPQRPPSRWQLRIFLSADWRGCPRDRCAPARRSSALAGCLGTLRPCALAARGGASRASPLLLLLLVRSTRLAASTPRHQLGDWERSRVGLALAGSGSTRRGQPGIAGIAGALHLCHAPATALASSRELSHSAGSLQLEHRRREFTASGTRKLFFDTHALVCLLEENGFTTQQAEIIVSALVKIMEAILDIVYKDMVNKMQQEITLQQIMSQIASVKKDMIILEKSEFSALRAENEKIRLELLQLKQQVMYSLNERKLLEMRTEVVALHAQQDRSLTQTDRKIDTEVAGLKTMLESHKLDNIKYLAGSVFTCLTVALGFYRLWA